MQGRGSLVCLHYYRRIANREVGGEGLGINEATRLHRHGCNLCVGMVYWYQGGGETGDI